MKLSRIAACLVVTFLAMGAAWAQQSQEPVPDAPSASKPVEPSFPGAENLPSRPAQQPSQPQPDETEKNQPEQETESEPAPPNPETSIRTVPAGEATPAPGSDRERLFTVIKDVNFVLVPVTVRDDHGRLVDGLLQKDFSIYENGERKPIQFFTSDPFPLSAAIVLDMNLNDLALRDVEKTIPALVGAFSPYDEVAYYTYGNVVNKVTEYTAALENLRSALKATKMRGRVGVPVVGGPFGSGPTVNGRPVDPGQPTVLTPPQESHVLNDAILAAALDLSHRERTRRKIIFVISDGLESGSRAGYGDVLKVLLSQEITVYAVGLSGAAVPGYRDLQRISIPYLRSGNVLPKYASATGGEVLTALGDETLERIYGQITEMARNQYTIGYTTQITAASNYRSIEVLVHRPELKVFAKDGYYPLPPRPEPQSP